MPWGLFWLHQISCWQCQTCLHPSYQRLLACHTYKDKQCSGKLLNCIFISCVSVSTCTLVENLVYCRSPPRHICQPFISTLEQKKEKHSTNSHNASYMWLLCITCFTHLKPPRIAKRITSGSMCLGLSAFMKFVSRYRKKVELWGLESIRRGHL